ncbi:MAG: hypothetical protein K5891_03380 [Lachnospiraceae bacterium]|nr:hypothetical protein [Lachnospiraceae bacterium]
MEAYNRSGYRTERMSRGAGGYQYGTAARNYRQPHQAEREYRANQASPERKRLHIVDIAGSLLVLAAFAICALVMVNYVRLQGELTAARRAVSAQEIRLSEMRSQNDARYSEILAGVNLGEIESIAREELGMNYAGEGQMIYYSTDTTDYMRKVIGTD